MEIVLQRSTPTTATVTVDGQLSHTFDLRTLLPDAPQADRPPHPLLDAAAYGRAAYRALFPAASLAAAVLTSLPATAAVALVTSDDDLDALPWEYAHSSSEFLVLEHPFVRALPAGRRRPAPTLDGGLHIVALPSNPLSDDVPPLAIEDEWQRLVAVIQDVPYPITLVRCRPPTLEQLRRLVADQRQAIVHFMGHGGRHEGQAVLLCEGDDGAPVPGTAADVMRRLRGSTFLVTLNACVTAAPGETPFANLAALLVNNQVPYALGMRFPVADPDALTFSRVLYSELARSSAVEEAVYQARVQLAAASHSPWAVGVPVLYTSLVTPASLIMSTTGTPHIVDSQPPTQVSDLPRAEGTFQGRTTELQELGRQLTGSRRPRLLTIHGGGGQGKTALAREAVERFAHAFPGGAWGIALETLPTRAAFVAALAGFLKIPVQEIAEPDAIERAVLARLGQQRYLLVLDNVETLVTQVADEQRDVAACMQARDLAEFLRQRLAGPTVTLLATSRVTLGWPGEVTVELEGLDAVAGARLFSQSAPQRAAGIDPAAAQALSRQVAGHPLSLRLLGGAFNATGQDLAAFSRDLAQHLLQAADRYKAEDHRHRTLYTCIDTSVHSLPPALRDLLSGLWLFHAPFLAETATTIFDPDAADGASPVPDRLYSLWQRGLLAVQEATLRDGRVRLFRLLPVVRVYVERYLPCAFEVGAVHLRFSMAYAGLARELYRAIDRSQVAVYLAQESTTDLTRGLAWASGETLGYYLLHWGWVRQRLGDRAAGQDHLGQALELAQDRHPRLALEALNNMAGVYYATGQPARALALYEQALPIRREVGDRAGEATTLNNMAGVYYATGQPARARALYEQALPIRREVGDRAGEAATLNGLAYLHVGLGHHGNALELFQQSIELERLSGHHAGESAGLTGLAVLMYQHMGQPAEGVARMENAVAVLASVGLSHDAAGRSLSQLQQMLEDMRRGTFGQGQAAGPATLPTDVVLTLVGNTIAVLTLASQQRAGWRTDLARSASDARQRGPDWQIEVDFFEALLTLVDGQPASLPADHPYAGALQAVRDGVAAGAPPDTAQNQT